MKKFINGVAASFIGEPSGAYGNPNGSMAPQLGVEQVDNNEQIEPSRNPK